ncbi:MAG: fold metallo-hydrolase [Chloroflexi bacterium]|nr:fold metallo-hydrolase [Chloroflexota bacterium]
MHGPMDIEVFTTRGLGDASYLIASEGEAALVDPQRDAWRFLAVAAERGWRVTRVIDTHVHNDYLSGALETRAATGAEIVAPARGSYAFAHRGAEEGTTIEVGALRLTAMATPGHTPEHLAWAIRGAGVPQDTTPDGVFTGGSLLVGTAGRTDLLGDELTDELTALQAQSLRRLAALPFGVRILPTHGAGSFCSAGSAAPTRTTTVGAELTGNPVLAAMDGADFRETLLRGVGRFPAYYARMAPLNRAGPAVHGGPPASVGLDPAGLERAVVTGVRIVDARPRAAFAAAHIPGSLSVELDDSFSAYVGWVLPFDAPLALVLPAPAAEARAEAIIQLFRIGYEHVAGHLEGGVGAWEASGRPISSFPTTTMDDVFAEAVAGQMPALLDVRQPIEWHADGVIPGAQTIFVADLPGRLAELPRDRRITVACKAGGRAAIAASVLDAAGFDVRLVAVGGQVGWPERFARLG